MARMPRWLKVEWSTRPTAIDKHGSGGLYVVSSKITWWYKPVALFKYYFCEPKG